MNVRRNLSSLKNKKGFFILYRQSITNKNNFHSLKSDFFFLCIFFFLYLKIPTMSDIPEECKKHSKMDLEYQIIGVLASIVSLSSYIPITIDVFNNPTKYLVTASYWLYSMYITSNVLWLIYGLGHRAIPVIISSCIVIFISLVILIFLIIMTTRSNNNTSEELLNK